MRKLVIMVWEAAVPPCVCAILVVVTYLTLVRLSFYISYNRMRIYR